MFLQTALGRCVAEGIALPADLLQPILYTAGFCFMNVKVQLKACQRRSGFQHLGLLGHKSFSAHQCSEALVQQRISGLRSKISYVLVIECQLPDG